MSHQAFVDFLEAVNGDAQLRARVAAIQAPGAKGAVARLIAIGRKAGYSFTEAEIDQLFLASARGAQGRELSTEELEAVAGGTLSELQEMSMSFNMQYLQLQQQMQQENRQFTMMSNIMKTKHDTAKAAIDNVR